MDRRRRRRVKAAFDAVEGVSLVDGTEDDLLAQMRQGEVDAVIVVPAGYGESVAAGGTPATLTVYTDPSQSQADGRTRQLVGFVIGAVNQAASGEPPAVLPSFETIQTNDFNYLSYLIPSILAMSLMQGGVFSAIPLVADREKLILKRLGATPLRRWQLVGSNILVRLLVALDPDGHHRRRRDAAVRPGDDRAAGWPWASSSCSGRWRSSRSAT